VRKIGTLKVSAVGFVAMALSHEGGPGMSDDEVIVLQGFRLRLHLLQGGGGLRRLY
jgi:hypothetical protein